MKNEKFDAIVASIHDEATDSETAQLAAGRVRDSLFAAQPAAGALRSCADFQSLIPSYLNRTLASGKALLLTDHTHSCVACRQALDGARAGNLRVLARPKTVSTHVSPVTKWAVAALVTLGVGAATWGVVRSMIVPPGTRATVQSVSGTLFQVADFHSTPLFTGRQLGERQVVRTAKDSTAMLQLADGSLVEMNGRSELYVSQASRGATIHLAHGDIIVHAAKQRHGALYVKTADCEVAVKGTIFAVTAATKGSRVAVVEGSVQVAQGAQTEMLKPGDEVTTSPAVAKVPIQDEVAWSRDSAKYLSILGELSGLQKQIDQIPGPGLRTTSKLLEYVPANTALYAAIPNIGSTLTEANRVFQERMQSSPVLKQWWAEQGDHQEFQTMLQKVQTISGYLGNEIVLAIPVDDSGVAGQPVIMAETQQPGLKEFVTAEIQSANAKAGRSVLQLVENPAQIKAVPADQKSSVTNVYIGNGIVALTPDPARIADLAAHFQQSSTSEKFSDTGMYERVQQAYQSGVGWLLCANLQKMSVGGVNARQAKRAVEKSSGFEDVQYLVVERKEVNGQIQNQATLSFAGNRLSLASWLAAPAPMSTLDFVSPDASLAASFVIQNPGALLTEFLSQEEAGNQTLQQEIQNIQNSTGVNFVNDIANSLGGELTFAIDGPLVPVPSWKLAVEVYNPNQLEWSFEKLINAFNQQPNAPVQLQLTQTQANSRTYYKVTGSNANSGTLPAEIDYTFVDGYLLAAANQTLLDTSIQNRSTGYTLSRSDKFRAQLPQDGNSNFSALVYHNVAGLVGPLVDQLKSTNALSADQKQAVSALQSNSAPGLIYAYGQPNQITIAANGGLFGFNLDSLALPAVLHKMMRMQPKTQ